jgi:hypothetical protein
VIGERFVAMMTFTGDPNLIKRHSSLIIRPPTMKIY